MSPQWSLLAFTLLFVIIAEGLMWTMYRHRTSAMRFPRAADESHIRLFTYGRMRYIIAIHTLMMMVVCILAILWLW